MTPNTYSTAGPDPVYQCWIYFTDGEATSSGWVWRESAVAIERARQLRRDRALPVGPMYETKIVVKVSRDGGATWTTEMEVGGP